MPMLMPKPGFTCIRSGLCPSQLQRMGLLHFGLPSFNSRAHFGRVSLPKKTYRKSQNQFTFGKTWSYTYFSYNLKCLILGILHDCIL